MFDRLTRPWRSRTALDDGRWIVLDVESSGLDASRDRLLAVAAVAVRIEGTRARIALGDSFECVLRQGAAPAVPDKHNILLHGIGVGAQRAGMAPEVALRALADWIGHSPLLAFHAAFDQTMLGRACDEVLGARLPSPWLDLAPLAEVLMPERKARSLDEWMAALGIVCAVRHQAAADALATAELLLRLWPLLCRQLGAPRFRAAADLAAQRRWLPQ